MPPTLAHEPHKIKTIRPVAFPSLEERKKNLAEAHFNVFNLTPSRSASTCARWAPVP